MAESVAVQIAEAIKDALVTEVQSATTTFSLQFEPQRRWMPEFDRITAGQLLVTVIPRTDTATLETRASTKHIYTAIIDVRRAIDPQHPDQVDLMVKLVEEILDFLRKVPMATANWQSANADFLYSSEDLYQHHQFVAQIEATYSKHRSIA